ncbi:hypothetical protein KX816_07080 [Sphingosinicellaceae bacterium]|nr:hypothetical protein KX816_07080 [Sphingosinicellaceae bacterium]
MSKGMLQRSKTKFGVATFRDCVDYNYRTISNTAAVHTADFSCYGYLGTSLKGLQRDWM